MTGTDDSRTDSNAPPRRAGARLIAVFRGLSWRKLATINLALAVGLALLLDRLVGFDDSKIGAGLFLTGTLMMGWPGLVAYHVMRQRARVDETVLALLERMKQTKETEERDSIQGDIDRLQKSIKRDGEQVERWDFWTELLFYLGYLAFLTAAIGRLL